MHKFFEKSLATDLICNFLYEYWLPTYDTVQTGDYIQSGYNYIYQNNVIYCTVSGYINGKYIQQLDPNDNSQLLDTRYYKAEFKTLWPYYIGNRYRKFTNNYIPTTSVYSSELHERLGKFVTAYSDVTGINLKPYYNFNSNHYVDNLDIQLSRDEETGKTTYLLADARTNNKMLVLPIRFNRTYTVAIDCPGQVLMCPVFLTHNRRLVLTNPEAKQSADKEKDITNLFLEATNQFFNFSSMSFSSPQYIEIKCKEDIAKTYYKYYNNLHLVIQLPQYNTSSVVVLEGKYKNISSVFEKKALTTTGKEDTTAATYKFINQKTVNFIEHDKLNNFQLNNNLISDLSLLQFNTRTQIPFANRLMEYLFDNVIDYTWKLDTNIERAQKLLTNISITNLNSGIWGEDTRIKMFDYTQQQLKSRHLDLSGNIDRETERLLLLSANNLENKF